MPATRSGGKRPPGGGASRLRDPGPLSAERWLSRADFDSHQEEILVTLGLFFVRYLRRVHREFDGDLLEAIVLGEVAHHNIRAVLQAGRRVAGRARVPALDALRVSGRLLACNAYSISRATGLPRETVRRRVASLVARGWLARTGRGELHVTDVPGRVFAEFNYELANGVLEMSHALSRAGGRRRRT